MTNSDLSLIRKRIEDANNIAIFAHVRPDGDAIGSVTGLGWALLDCGKKVQFVCEDEIPAEYDHLFKLGGSSCPFISQPEPYDCAILVDISDLGRAGKYFLAPDSPVPDICIDHHVSNQGIGKLNWIEAENAASACVLNGIMPHLGLQISQRTASALLWGILTDTLGFSTSNTDPVVLRAAADLVDAGADIFQLTQKALKEHTPEASRYWGCGLRNMQIDGNIIWSVLGLEDRKAAGYEFGDDAEFVNYLACNDSTSVTVLFVEQSADETKVSWRAKPGYDVQKIASVFGGGGHKAAAGATLYGSLGEIIEKVLMETRKCVELKV